MQSGPSAPQDAGPDTPYALRSEQAISSCLSGFVANRENVLADPGFGAYSIEDSFKHQVAKWGIRARIYRQDDWIRNLDRITRFTKIIHHVHPVILSKSQRYAETQGHT